MDKREIVIETARELFKRYGYKKVTMDEIAKESNVTKKTIYTYFKDKESLFEYFVREELLNMKSEIEDKKKKMNFIDFISDSIYQMLLFRKNSDLINNIFKEAASEEKAKNFIKIFDNEILDYIEEQINIAIENGDINKCNSKLTAFIIYKVYISVLFEYDNNLDEELVTKEITSILKNGLLN